MANEETKKCPFCGEEILSTAVKCKHCGEFLDGRQKEQSMSVASSITYNRRLTIHCPNCGYEGKPKKDTPGSIWLELLLWLFFLIPGLIYSFWRMCATCTCKCPKCGNTALAIKQNN